MVSGSFRETLQRNANPRAAAAGLFALQLVLFVVAVISERRYMRAPVDKSTLVILGCATYLLSIRVLLVPPARGWQRTVLVLPACVLTCIYYTPALAELRAELGGGLNEHELLRRERLIAVLSNVSAAEEQARLVIGSYVASRDSLSPWLPGISSSYRFRIDEVTALGWSARVSDGETSCEIWSRDVKLRPNASTPEGEPVCESSGALHVTPASWRRVVKAAPAARSFDDADVTGIWTQHRGDSTRSGIVPDTAAPARWTAVVEGELRAPVAIAGNQVFVGAHGNGEFEALSLRDGRVGFRLRTPNWTHHEPVITKRLVIVGFGDNRRSMVRDDGIGTDPSGLVAYDRRTGREIWRYSTHGAVMTSPVLYDSLVVGVSGRGEVFAVNTATGRAAWTAQLPSYSAMGNPLLVDSTLAIGIEPTTICTLRITSGRLLYCKSLGKVGWGAGHTSIAVAGDEYLVVYDGRGHVTLQQWMSAVLASIRPSWRPFTPLVTGELVAVAVDRATGNSRWSTPLGVGTVAIQGHIAGTPTVVDGVAYIPSHLNGRVVAIEASSGRTLWSTRTETARGSLLVIDQRVVGATRDSSLVVLDAHTGAVVCRERLPDAADRAGPTVSGRTGILTLKNGLVLARPVSDWLACKA